MPQDKQDEKRLSRNNYYLPSLIIITLIAVLVKYHYQTSAGPGWDTYSFCLNALKYAGMGTGYYEFDRGPFFPFLLSLIFRLGFVTEKAAMLLDSIFLFIGGIVLYKLVGLKCPKVVAFFSGLIFVTSSVMMGWCSVGYADITSVTLSIAAIYLFILGVERDRRYLLLSWPVAMCAFLSRTTAALIIFPMLFYFLFMPKQVKLLKHNILGIILGILVYLPVAWFYQVNKGDPIFYVKLVLSGLSTTGDSIGVGTEGIYGQSQYYFLEQLRGSIVNSSIYPIMAVMVLVGVVLLVFRYLSSSRKRPNTFMLFVFFVLLYCIFFERLSFKFLEMLLLMTMAYFYYYSRPNLEDNKALFCVMMVFWGLSYFIFHSTFYQKVPRYYLPMMPSIAFITSLSLYELGNALDTVANKDRLFLKGISLFLAFSFLFTCASAIESTRLDEGNKEYYSNILDMSAWIKGNVEDFDESLVYSDYWVAFGWQLDKTILSMPQFFDSRYLDHEMMKYGVDYYITNKTVPYTEELYQAGDISLLKLAEIIDKPRGLYIGNGWENYFEYLMDFSCYLVDGTTHIDQASDFVDDYTLEELSEYDFLALFTFKWHDSEQAESLLTQYMEQGGTVLLDCSGNLEDPIYTLSYVQLFDMIVRRDSLQEYPLLEFSGTPTYYEFSPFDYDGSTWYGATYAPVGSAGEIEIVALANDDILVAIEHIGEGNLVWMGYNIVYHSFLNDNHSEMEFLQYVLDYTVGS